MSQDMFFGADSGGGSVDNETGGGERRQQLAQAKQRALARRRRSRMHSIKPNTTSQSGSGSGSGFNFSGAGLSDILGGGGDDLFGDGGMFGTKENVPQTSNRNILEDETDGFQTNNVATSGGLNVGDAFASPSHSDVRDGELVDYVLNDVDSPEKGKGGGGRAVNESDWSGRRGKQQQQQQQQQQKQQQQQQQQQQTQRTHTPRQQPQPPHTPQSASTQQQPQPPISQPPTPMQQGGGSTPMQPGTPQQNAPQSQSTQTPQPTPTSGNQQQQGGNGGLFDDGESSKQVKKKLADRGIEPTFDPNNEYTERKEKYSGQGKEEKKKKKSVPYKLDLTDMKKFLTSPVPQGRPLQCFIIRNRKGIRKKMFPRYEVFLEESDRFLMAARKRSGNKTSNYLISMDRDKLEKGTSSYLGKLRSNVLGTTFHTYDRGINPKDRNKKANKGVSEYGVRQELAVTEYASTIFGAKGPRKMRVLLPRVREENQREVWRPMKPNEGMYQAYKEDEELDKMIVLTNKKPHWNDQVSAYVLNFHGRVTMPSVKNFQLVERYYRRGDDEEESQGEEVILQFGRIGKDTFTMDLRWPITPMQGFSVCLSSFDHKLACE